MSNIKFFLIAASLILVDLFSKGYVEDLFQQGDVVNILPFLVLLIQSRFHHSIKHEDVFQSLNKKEILLE